jgi:S1-C subfamily serine protease
LTSQDEITRTADRLKDAFGAAADVMTAGASPVRGAAADVITAGDSPVRIRGSRIGHGWKWLVPLTAAASVAAIALAEVLVGHPATNTSTSGPFTQMYNGNGKAAHLVNVPAPDPAVLNSPGERAADSRVVKILGSAPACDKDLQGSGFVYAPQHVITNAHVVAGVTRGQTVTTADGMTYRARVVFYDPRIDIAVLDVPGLNLAPLRFNTQAHLDDNAVVAGYTENHSFTTAPARIGQVLRAESPDIYGSGQVDRQIYQIRGGVKLGNSGGPLLSPGGTVDGVVFDRAAGVPDTAFVLAASAVQADANAGANATVPVSTQGCTPG